MIRRTTDLSNEREKPIIDIKRRDSSLLPFVAFQGEQTLGTFQSIPLLAHYIETHGNATYRYQDNDLRTDVENYLTKTEAERLRVKSPSAA